MNKIRKRNQENIENLIEILTNITIGLKIKMNGQIREKHFKLKQLSKICRCVFELRQ